FEEGAGGGGGVMTGGLPRKVWSSEVSTGATRMMAAALLSVWSAASSLVAATVTALRSLQPSVCRPTSFGSVAPLPGEGALAPGGKGAEAAGQTAVADPGAGGARAPGHARRQRVGDRHAVGVAGAGVADDDGEDRRVPGVDRPGRLAAAADRLGHVDVGAVDGDGGGRGVVALVGNRLVRRGHRRRV